MKKNSSEERLRKAHQIVDKELQSNFPAPSTNDGSSRTKFVQSEISDLERKLINLQKKMNGEIKLTSSDEEDNNVNEFKKRLNQALSKDKQKDSKLVHSGKKDRKFQKPSSDQDSEDGSDIYAKVMAKKNKPQPQPKTNNNSSLRRPQVSSQKQKSGICKSNASLRESIKSFKSNKSHSSRISRKSNYSKKSQTSKQENTNLRALELQNAKDGKKISNLQNQLVHYKRLCKRQQEKLQQYRILQIEFRKLQANFTKSEQIRKQQKKIIEGLKSKY